MKIKTIKTMAVAVLLSTSGLVVGQPTLVERADNLTNTQIAFSDNGHGPTNAPDISINNADDWSIDYSFDLTLTDYKSVVLTYDRRLPESFGGLTSARKELDGSDAVPTNTRVFWQVYVNGSLVAKQDASPTTFDIPANQDPSLSNLIMGAFPSTFEGQRFATQGSNSSTIFGVAPGTYNIRIRVQYDVKHGNMRDGLFVLTAGLNDDPLGESLQSLQSQIDANKSAITALETSQTAQDTAIAALQADTADLQDQIDALETAQTALTDRVTQNETDIASIQDDFTDLQDQVNDLANDVMKNTNDIADLALDVAQNSTDIASNDADIATLQDGQASNDAEILANAQEILGLQNELSTSNDEINNLRKELSDAQDDSDKNDLILGGAILGGLLIQEFVLNEYFDWSWGHNHSYIYNGSEGEMLQQGAEKNLLRLSGYSTGKE